MAHNAIAGFPAQRLSFSRKSKEWGKKYVEFGEDHSLLHYHLTDNDDICPSVSLLGQEQPLVMAANEYAEKLKEKEADPLESIVGNQAAYGGRIYDGILEPTNQMKKGRYWTDDNSILPELLVYPDRMHKNDYVRDEAGNPAKTVGAIRDINPNAHIYERVNKELADNQYRTMPTNSEANVFADAWTEQTAPTVGHLIAAGLKPLDLITPSRYVGLLDSDNKNGFMHLFDEDNKGFFIGNDPTKPFSKKFAQEHPYMAGLTNMMGDAILGYGIGKTLDYGIPFVTNIPSKTSQYMRLKKTYAGVPHRQVEVNGKLVFDGNGQPVYMDESFPKTHNVHTVWTSDDVDYARSGTWSKYNNNTVFDVYADPKEISVLETPPVPENQMVYWQGLPYKLENGTVTYADNARVVNEGLPRNKELAFTGKDSYGRYKPEVLGHYIEKDNEFGRVKYYKDGWKRINSKIKTDDVVKYSADNGYDATRFNRVYDGGIDLGEYFDYPINELVFNRGASKYVLPHGTPKYKILGQLPNKYTLPSSFRLSTFIPITTTLNHIADNE
jgi:hypothetical protein